MSGGLGHRARSIALLVLLSAVMMPTSLRAQVDRLYLSVGTRVRVQTVPDGPPFTGTVWRITADTLAVAVSSGNALLQLPMDRLASIDVSEGRDRLGWSVRGASIGALSGGLIGSIAVWQESHGDLGVLAGFFAGGMLGATGGALLGAITAPERWSRVRARVVR